MISLWKLMLVNEKPENPHAGWQLYSTLYWSMFKWIPGELGYKEKKSFLNDFRNQFILKWI